MAPLREGPERRPENAWRMNQSYYGKKIGKLDTQGG